MELLAIYVASAHTKQWRIKPIGWRLMSRGSNGRVDMIMLGPSLQSLELPSEAPTLSTRALLAQFSL